MQYRILRKIFFTLLLAKSYTASYSQTYIITCSNCSGSNIIANQVYHLVIAPKLPANYKLLVEFDSFSHGVLQNTTDSSADVLWSSYGYNGSVWIVDNNGSSTSDVQGNNPYGGFSVTIPTPVHGGWTSDNSSAFHNRSTILYTTTSPTGGTCGSTGSYKFRWQFAPFLDVWHFQNGGGNDTSYNYTTPPITASAGGSIRFRRLDICGTDTGFSEYGQYIPYIYIYPEPLPGVITPEYLVINSGTSPGTLTTNAAASSLGGFNYQWQNSSDGINFINISGAISQNYTPGNLTTTTYYRRRAVSTYIVVDTEYTKPATIVIGTLNNNDMSYVRVRDFTKPGITDTVTSNNLTDPNDVKQTTQYFDGLGRLIQTVSKKTTPLQKDLVIPTVYDILGRESIQYLPFVSTSSDGNYKSSPLTELNTFNSTQFPGEQFFYRQTNYEPSPLNRVSNTFSPGNSWVGNDQGISTQFIVNTVDDGARFWTITSAPGSIPISTSIYNPGQLFKDSSINESNQITLAFKDKQGKLILKKVLLVVSLSPGQAFSYWLSTYYVYDTLDNLRFVLQPKAVDLINSNWVITQSIADELCFRYEYDERKRMIIKKIPGAAEQWMVYDARDRLVMSQDGFQRTNNKWITNQYDSLNRIWRIDQLSDNNNRIYHQNLAANSLVYPNMTGAIFETVKRMYFDDYTWVGSTGAAINSTLINTFTSNSTYFITTYNTGPTYAQSITPNYQTKGMSTGERAEILGSGGLYSYTSIFYDDRGRVIQKQTQNYTVSRDTTTMQYDFSGKLLRTFLQQKKGGANAQNHRVLTKLSYDAGGRLLTIQKNIDNAASDQTIATSTYNELGQLQNKQLGNNLETLAYEYNIRGWLITINKNYISGATNTNYFGMELAYDKITSVASTTSYWGPQLNGNIAGTIWKSAGDGVGRKYDFHYDNLNRLNAANFVQNTSGSTWDNSYIDFSTTNSYDANGNILSMDQKGFKVGGSGYIDQLTYTYGASNKLSIVNDASNDPNSKLGDFHYAGSKHSTDYTYDGSGNMIIDNNKGITAIDYSNWMELPKQITITGKGTISYQTDANGIRFKKTTVDNTVAPSKTTVTTYMDGLVYLNDTLQFVSTEEGRARWAYHKYLNGTTAYGYEYDFFVKDHLGNTRVVLTQQKDTAQYLATMEAAYRNTEKQLFNNITTTNYARASASGYPVDLTVTNPNDSVIKVNGSGQKIGPNLLLKVMSGDKIDIAVQYYFNSTGTAPTPVSSLNDVLNSLANGIVTMTAGAKGTVGDFTNPAGSVYGALNNFINTNDPTPATKPKAYLNWMLLDEQLKYVSSYPQSSAMPVVNSGTNAGALQTPLSFTGIPITKSGYLYIWVSNETPGTGWDVFFDNLSIKHYAGPLLEETHYYPFGLTMAGISSKALKPNYAENKYRYNKGSELQNNEFSDGSGLELYTTELRSLDPQLGRWWQIDSKPTESESPYAAMRNNPILYTDPLGDTLEGIDKQSAKREQKIIKGSFKDNKSVQKLFKVHGSTFKHISDKKFDKVTKNLTKDQKSLAKGYKDVINSSSVYKVEVVKQNESLSDFSQNIFQMSTGADVNTKAGGGITTSLDDGSHLSVLVMDATRPIPFVDRATGNQIWQPSSAGELSAHEILGHGLADQLNSINASGLNSVQATNLYLRSQNITSYYRTEHDGLPFFSNKAEDTPDYLK